MYDAIKSKFIDYKAVFEKFNVKPSQIIDFLSLIGDSSDNVPGVKGIGNKAASELLNQFDNIEDIYQNIEIIQPLRRQQLLKDGYDNAKLSKSLIKLDEDVKLDFNIDNLALREINSQKLVEFLAKQGFASIFKRLKTMFNLDDISYQDLAKKQAKQIFQEQKDLDLMQGDLKNNHENNYQFQELQSGDDFQIGITKDAIKEIKDLNDELLKKLIARSHFVIFDIINNIDCNILSIAFGDDFGNILSNFYYKLSNIDDLDILFEINNANNSDNVIINQDLSIIGDLFSDNLIVNKQNNNSYQDCFAIKENDDILQKSLIINKIIASHNIKKIFVNSKNWLKLIIKANKINAFNIVFEDLTILDYLLNSNLNAEYVDLLGQNIGSDYLDDKSQLIYDDFINDYQNFISNKNNQDLNGSDIINIKLQKIIFYNSYFTGILYIKLAKELQEKRLFNLYYNIERPLLIAIAKMESSGIMIDIAAIKEMSSKFAVIIANITKEIYHLAGTEFNIASPKQLSHILFDNLRIGEKLNIKTNSTNIEILEEISLAGYIIADKIIEFRHFSKLKNTYLDRLLQQVKNGRIYGNFFSNATITGRFSSRNPNLQNIPLHSKEGKMIRNCFISPQSKSLICVDYSQIELRILASIANVRSLIDALNNDIDIHKVTASEVFKIDIKEVDDALRSKAKAINFGIIYGISSFGLAKQLRISRSEAKNYIDSYFASYPGIKEYIEDTVNKAREHKKVATIFGHLCHLKNIDNKNPILRNEAERLAVNATIQGSAADIIKKAMIDLQRIIDEQKLEVKILSQIHDELIIEANDSNIVEVVKIVEKTMTEVVEIAVKLKVDINIAKKWQ
jgi:DNA polymerase-1